MLRQDFSVAGLRRLVRKSDFARYEVGSPSLIDCVIENIVARIDSDNFVFDGIVFESIGGKRVVRLGSLDNELVIRKVNDNLKRLYKVKQSNRNAIISQVVGLLRESAPMSVFRADIRSFYESVDRGSVLSKVLGDYLLNSKSKKYYVIYLRWGCLLACLACRVGCR